MPLTACPISVVDAPIQVVWSLLSPAHLDDWWDAKVRSVTPVTPDGPLSKGQRIEAGSGPWGRFTVIMDVLDVDAEEHRARLLIRLPFGIVNDQTISMVQLGPDRCRVGYG